MGWVVEGTDKAFGCSIEAVIAQTLSTEPSVDLSPFLLCLRSLEAGTRISGYHDVSTRQCTIGRRNGGISSVFQILLDLIALAGILEDCGAEYSTLAQRHRPLPYAFSDNVNGGRLVQWCS